MQKKNITKSTIATIGIASALGISGLPSQAADPIGSFTPTVEQICSGLNEMPLRDRIAYVKHYPECASPRKAYEPFPDLSDDSSDPMPTIQPTTTPTIGPTAGPTAGPTRPQPTRPTKPPPT